jgi:hypothetical protein
MLGAKIYDSEYTVESYIRSSQAAIDKRLLLETEQALIASFVYILNRPLYIDKIKDLIHLKKFSGILDSPKYNTLDIDLWLKETPIRDNIPIPTDLTVGECLAFIM